MWTRAFEANGNQSFLGRNVGFVSDTQLVSPALQSHATDPVVVTIQHAYDIEQAFDGGVIEYTTDGLTWHDVTAAGIDPGYNGPLLTNTGNPIAGRAAFHGTSPGFPARSQLTLDFGTQLAAYNVFFLRFRIGTDGAVGGAGWDIDDIAVSGITNLPFPVLVPETTKCMAATRVVEDSQLVTNTAPAKSLRAFDAGVCIANDL